VTNAAPAYRRWLPWVLVLLVLVALAGLWRFSPLGEWTEPEKLAGFLESLVESPWAPLSIALAYLAASATLFPAIALNLALILLLGPLIGVATSLYGLLVAGVAALLLGRGVGQGWLRRQSNPRLKRVLGVVRDSGLPGMILLRMVPVAPYPVVNFAVGASGIGIGVFALGTVLGVLPSLVAMGLIGVQLKDVWANPDVQGVLVLLGIVALYAVLAWWLKRRLSAALSTPTQGD